MSNKHIENNTKGNAYWSTGPTLNIGNVTITREGIRYDDEARSLLEKCELATNVNIDR